MTSDKAHIILNELVTEEMKDRFILDLLTQPHQPINEIAVSVARGTILFHSRIPSSTFESWENKS